MNYYRWSDLDVAPLLAGITGSAIIGSRVMLCRFRYDPYVIEPAHSHESEQLSYVIEGRVRFQSEGRTIVAVPGDVLHFGPNVPHGLEVLNEAAEMIEIFSPLRADLISAMKTPAANKLERKG